MDKGIVTFINSPISRLASSHSVETNPQFPYSQSPIDYDHSYTDTHEVQRLRRVLTNGCWIHFSLIPIHGSYIRKLYDVGGLTAKFSLCICVWYLHWFLNI